MSDTSALNMRFRALPGGGEAQFSPADELRLEGGTLRDYHALSEFHYKGSNPGAVTAVYRLVHRAPTVVGRYISRAHDTAIAGVLLRSLPHLGCQLRDHATHYRYRGFGSKGAAAMLNREMRTISRVVIDPRWRGLGLAVKLVRRALDEPETIYTEALAAMGRVHPFFEKAGMTRYDRPARNEHARMLDALDHVGVEPHRLAAPASIAEELEHRPEMHTWLDGELRRWHRAAFRTPKADLSQFSTQQLLACARDRLLSQPVYYLTRHDL